MPGKWLIEMRIASVLIIALTVSAFGGLSVAGLIDRGYHGLQDIEEAAGRDSVAIVRLRGFLDAMEQALVSADLVVGSNVPYLAPGALKQIDGLAEDVAELRGYGSFERAGPALDGILSNLRQIGLAISASSARTDDDADLLTNYDFAVASLAGLASNLESAAQARATDAQARVRAEQEHRHKADIFLLSAYTVLMTLVLLVLLRQIGRPVLRLTVDAEDAMELGHRFQPEKRGPSEIRQLGETIARFVGDLESKVAERTAELSSQADELIAEIENRQAIEKKLRSTILVAEAANHAKSEFLSVISHELRTPMNAVLGILDLLCDTRLDSDQRLYIETARDSGGALMSLLNDILDMSKIESGRMELVDRDFDLPESIDQAISLFHPNCCAKRVVLAAIIDPDVPRVMRGDPLRLRQILTNILGNAVKFTDDGHIHLHVETFSDNAGRRCLKFTVEDTGVGIEAGDQGDVFSEFTQVERSSTRKYGGSGLGLAISRRLVESMGGEIGLESAPGVGSRFWFTVPLACPSHPKPEFASEIRRQLAETDVVISGSCYVLAETIKRVLSGWAASVRVVSQEADFARLVSNSSAKMTFILCGPPDVPGWARAARRLDSCPASARRIAIVPCIVGARASAREHGIFEVIHEQALKPHSILQAACGLAVESTGENLHDNLGLPGGRVLLVEDSPANILVASAVLEKAGYAVDIAENGKEALDAAMARPPDIILMDLQMPVMDGYKAAAEIRKMPGINGRVPIIALTANVMAESDARERSTRFDGYLSKPYERRVLLDIVRSHIRTRHIGNGTSDITGAGRRGS